MKAAVRMHIYRLGLQYFYQSDSRRSARSDFSSSLTKIASGRLVEDTQSFFQRVVTKVKTWYTETSKDLIDISSAKMDVYFKDLATELGIDLKGAISFTPSSIDWSRDVQRSR
jgi:hypothetical protein